MVAVRAVLLVNLKNTRGFMSIATIDPTTGEIIKTFASLTDEEIEAKLSLADACFQNYCQISFQQKGEWLRQAANILERDAAKFAAIMTLEMGKTLKSAVAEVQKCASVCHYYADNAKEILADITVATDASHSYIHHEPLGTILAVMPWNFPFWQVFRFAAPALMAGNVGILKHASNVPQSALAIEEILRDAGFPLGAFQTLLIGADKVTQIIADPRVKAATLTGSEAAGIALATEAGKQIKKVVLELGGSDPFIVLESADLNEAVNTAVTARMLNNGQSCIAAKRFIVADSIFDQFTSELIAKYRALKIGDPMLNSTDIGPLATPKILEELDTQVQKTIANGAKILTGGKPVDNCRGNYYLPTIITDITPENPIAKEEFFGPVALLFRVGNIEEAIAIANSTPFGLGASAWTNEDGEKQTLIDRIKAGAVFINGMVKSDSRLPFGGIGRSGYGRELGTQGILEFVNIKTIWIK
jgi:succinate-semialdehyde dehydrogenase/glutarate-semialdehyde dehydrogenase